MRQIIDEIFYSISYLVIVIAFLLLLLLLHLQIAISKETKRSEEEYKNLYNLALNGLQLLAKWTNTVLELVC